ncbi:MAG: hypothetical protein HQL50_09255 [Magnetococcales bacterium]|nr:hypothetical protein [Magnetococcales bacterium]
MEFVWIIVSVMIVGALTMWLERLKLFGNTVAWLVLPIVVACLWAISDSALVNMFSYIKFVSVIAACLMVAAMRFKGWCDHHWARVIMYLILFINICEGVGFEILDITTGGPERHYGGFIFNAMAGILILLTQAYPRLMQIDSSHPNRPLMYDLGLPWILAYMLWNITFIYGCNAPGEPAGQWAATGIAHLATPFLLMMWRKRIDLWFHARVISLTIYVVYIISFPREPWLPLTEEWMVREVADGMGIAAFVLALVMSILIVRGRAAGEPPRNLLESAWVKVGGR